MSAFFQEPWYGHEVIREAASLVDIHLTVNWWSGEYYVYNLAWGHRTTRENLKTFATLKAAEREFQRRYNSMEIGWTKALQAARAKIAGRAV